MKGDRARLRRLRLVARLREVEHRTAAAAAAEAAAAERRSLLLAQRAAGLSEDPCDHETVRDGLGLAARQLIAANLKAAVSETERAAHQARLEAEARLLEAHSARRKRDRLQELHGQLIRSHDRRQQAQTSHHTSRSPVGTLRE